MRETDVSTHFTDHKTEALTSVRAILGHKPGYEQREAETGILTPSLWFLFSGHPSGAPLHLLPSPGQGQFSAEVWLLWVGLPASASFSAWP